MRTHRLFSAAVALLATAATLGLAASPASAQTVRVEAHGGWDNVGNDVSDSGIVYGIGAGVDFDLSERVVAGVEANLDFSNVDECGTAVLAAGDELCIEARRDISAVARLGYRVTDNGLVYALAGYTNGRYRVDYDPAVGPSTSVSDNLDGLRVGVGYQHGFGNGLYSKVEYRYSNYEADVERHQVIAGIGVAF